MTPSAWKYEFASSISEDGYTNWQTGISATEPHMPAGSIRNVTPLYALGPRRHTGSACALCGFSLFD